VSKMPRKSLPDCWQGDTPSLPGVWQEPSPGLAERTSPLKLSKTMKAAGHDVRPTDPFAAQQTFGSLRTGVAPVVGRLQALWSAHRQSVIAAFPKPQSAGIAKGHQGLSEVCRRDLPKRCLSLAFDRGIPRLTRADREGWSWNLESRRAKCRSEKQGRPGRAWLLASLWQSEGHARSSQGPMPERSSAPRTATGIANYSSRAWSRG
jgi:hypothetical protein